MSSIFYSNMFSLQLKVSPHKKEISVSKGAIFNRNFLFQKNLMGTMRISIYQKKKLELVRFCSFGRSRVGAEEDDLPFENLRMKELETSLNGMSKWLVGGLFAIAIVWKRDAVTIWFAMGTFMNSILSTTLKKILNQQRPSALRTDPGMPSSHAQSIFYAVVFIIYSLMETMGVTLSSVLIGSIVFISGAYLSWLRVSQQLHTINQVIVGAALGSTCSLIWIWIWHLFVHRAFDSSMVVRSILLLGAATYYVLLLFYAIKQSKIQD